MKYFVFDIVGVLNNTQSKEFKKFFTLKNYYDENNDKANNLRKELLGYYMEGKIDFNEFIETMRPYLVDKKKSAEEYES
jgi:FMN phosphatase YigB (HAD superfamily)